MTTPILTPEQQAVVDADLIGPRLVDAGAGTGKTFTLVKRAVSLIERGTLRADELLVVTFTKAAATEIAGRLEAELDPHSHRRPTCGTFHGIASDLIREFAYEAGISPDVRVIDEGRARGVFARAFADLIAGRLDVDLRAFPLLERVGPLERSLAKIVFGLKDRDIAFDAWAERARAAATELETIEFGCVQMLSRNGKPLADWPRPRLPRSAEERRAEAERERRNVTVVAALFAHFQRLLDREHLLTFGDILNRATRMLRDHPTITDVVRKRWKHAIVDEFQDTNRTQIAFLEALFGPQLEPVLVVGDVRQAIYEFTGADPQGIIDFRARAREKFPLTVNRRSLAPILDVAHASLSQLGGVTPELNAQLVAHRGDADARCVKLELFSDEGALEREAACVAAKLRELVDGGVSPQRCAVLLRARTRAGAFAQAIREAGLAVQLLGGVGFFDAPEIREVVQWLRLAHDPTDAVAVVGTLQSAAIAVGDGTVALLARGEQVARTALLDALPVELEASERERLERYRRTARLVCALTDVPLVDAVRSTIWASGAEIARAQDGASLDQARANLNKLVRFAADFAADRPLARISDLVDELRERDELELDLPVAELEGDRIAIMTIHGAKGLEWDHVFVADIGSRSFPLSNNDQRENVAQIDASSGALALKHGVDKRATLRWYLTQHAHDDAGTVAKGPPATKDEEYRLLYVALTRARDAVYVTGRRTGASRISACFSAVRDWATGRSGSADLHGFAAAGFGEPPRASLHDPAAVAHSASDPVTAHGSIAERSRIERALTARKQRRVNALAQHVERRGSLSYTAMELHDRCPRRARYHYVLGLPDLSDQAAVLEVETDNEPRENRDPARYGRVIHRVLELLARARIAGVSREPDAALREACDEEAWATTVEERAVARAAVTAAAHCLTVLEPIAAEREFAVDIDGVRLAGFIDLIGRDPDGTIVIVDYKTGRTAAQHYALQFALYRRAVLPEFPFAASRLLRIGTQGATFESVTPATAQDLREAVARSRTMDSDEPRPGPGCAYCPYAHDVCSAAPRREVATGTEALSPALE